MSSLNSAAEICFTPSIHSGSSSILAVSTCPRTAERNNLVVDGRDAPQGRARGPRLRLRGSARSGAASAPAVRASRRRAHTTTRRRRAQLAGAPVCRVIRRRSPARWPASCSAGARSPLASALPPLCGRPAATPLSLPSRAGIVAAGAEHALAVDASGDVHVIGGGVGRRSSKSDACVPRPLGGMDGLRVLQVACGVAHSLLLVARRGEGGGEVHAVGENSCGQLGLGHTAPQPRPRRATELCAPGVSRVEAGASSSFAVAAAATRAVGCNSHGQLGNGRRAAAELRAVRVGGGAGETGAVARISVHPATAEGARALARAMGASRVWPSARGTASSSQSAALSSAAARMRSASSAAPTARASTSRRRRR